MMLGWVVVVGGSVFVADAETAVAGVVNVGDAVVSVSMMETAVAGEGELFNCAGSFTWHPDSKRKDIIIKTKLCRKWFEIFMKEL